MSAPAVAAITVPLAVAAIVAAGFIWASIRKLADTEHNVEWTLFGVKLTRKPAPAAPKKSQDSAVLAAGKTPAGAAVQNIDRTAASR